MAIAHVASQNTGAYANGTSVSVAFPGNVTAGSLIVVVGMKHTTGATDPFVVGDCTKTAGTATIGAFQMDVQNAFNYDGGAGGDWNSVAVFSAVVTGSGSCTITLAGAPAGSDINIGIDEFTGAWGAARFDTSSTNQLGTDDTGTGNAGNATSTGAGVFIGGICINTGARTVSLSGSFTNIYERETALTAACAQRIVGAATTDSATWTWSAVTGPGWTAAQAVYKEEVAAGPHLVSVDDMTPEEGTTLVVTGTALKASGNSTATIGGVSQTITTQSATVPELTVALGTLKFGTTYNLVITDSDAAPSNSFALTSLQPAAGNGFVDVGTPNADTSIRLTSIADAVSGDQVEWENSALITINSDLTWDADDSVTTIRARIWTAGDGYGPWTTQTINAATNSGAFIMFNAYKKRRF